MDDAVRSAERAWRATGAVTDAAAYVAALSRITIVPEPGMPRSAPEAERLFVAGHVARDDGARRGLSACESALMALTGQTRDVTAPSLDADAPPPVPSSLQPPGVAFVAGWWSTLDEVERTLLVVVAALEAHAIDEPLRAEVFAAARGVDYAAALARCAAHVETLPRRDWRHGERRVARFRHSAYRAGLSVAAANDATVAATIEAVALATIERLTVNVAGGDPSCAPARTLSTLLRDARAAYERPAVRDALRALIERTSRTVVEELTRPWITSADAPRWVGVAMLRLAERASFAAPLLDVLLPGLEVGALPTPFLRERRVELLRRCLDAEDFIRARLAVVVRRVADPELEPIREALRHDPDLGVRRAFETGHQPGQVLENFFGDV